MPLHAVVTDIASVDEAHRDFYAADKDGRYVLQVEPVDGFKLENIEGLTRALGAERHTNRQLDERIKSYGDLDPTVARDALTRVQAYGDLDPVKAREAMASLERLSKFDPEKEAERIAEDKFTRSKTQLQEQFSRRESELSTTLSSAQETLARREKQVETLLKQNAIKSALAQHNPLKDAVDVLERMIGDNVRMREVNGQYVVEVVDEKGTPLIKDYTGTPLSIADYVADLREKRAALFQPDQKHGVGLSATTQATSSPTEVKNPFVKGPHFSMTEQMVLLRTDPAKAQAFMAEAGL